MVWTRIEDKQSVSYAMKPIRRLYYGLLMFLSVLLIVPYWVFTGKLLPDLVADKIKELLKQGKI